MRCDESRDAPLSNKKKQYPLIMMSHGSGGDRYNMSWLAEVLTANGYIVCAMDHYGNTWNNKIPQFLCPPLGKTTRYYIYIRSITPFSPVRGQDQ